MEEWRGGACALRRDQGHGQRESAIGAIDFYTDGKSVWIDYSDKQQNTQIDRPE